MTYAACGNAYRGVYRAVGSRLKRLLTHPIKNKLGMLILRPYRRLSLALIAENFAPEAFKDVLDGKYLAIGFFFATIVVLVVSEFLCAAVANANVRGAAAGHGNGRDAGGCDPAGAFSRL